MNVKNSGELHLFYLFACTSSVIICRLIAMLEKILTQLKHSTYYILFWYPQIRKVRSHYHLFFKICTFLTYLSNETKASQDNSNFQSKGKALKLQLTNRPTLPWQHTILSIFPLEELQPKIFHATTHTNFTSLLALPRWRQLYWWGIHWPLVRIPCQKQN